MATSAKTKGGTSLAARGIERSVANRRRETGISQASKLIHVKCQPGLDPARCLERESHSILFLCQPPFPYHVHNPEGGSLSVSLSLQLQTPPWVSPDPLPKMQRLALLGTGAPFVRNTLLSPWRMLKLCFLLLPEVI